jgi:hypothetical protein
VDIGFGVRISDLSHGLVHTPEEYPIVQEGTMLSVEERCPTIHPRPFMLQVLQNPISPRCRR